MKTNTSSPITNGILMLAISCGFAFLGGLVNDWLFYSGLILCLFFVILWALSPKFNLFMESKIKIFTFVKYDCKNTPVYYLILLLCWLIILVWSFQDFDNYQAINQDTLIALFSVYLVSCTMIFWGYIKDYDRLP